MSVTLVPEAPRRELAAESFMSGVFEVEHPLIACHLTRLRDKSTPPPEFRALVNRLASLLAYEATKDLRTERVTVETPLDQDRGPRASRSGSAWCRFCGPGWAWSSRCSN